MVLVTSLGAVLKYGVSHMFGKTTAVMVELTPQEWADFQKAAADEHASAPSDLTKLATDAVADAHVTQVPAKGTVAVQFKAGDYAALAEAHAAVAPPPAAKPEAAAEPEKKAEPDPRDARIAELEAKLAEAGKGAEKPDKLA